MPSLTIGQLARLCGVGVETIRYYEREGLIATPPRRSSGYRQYPPSALARLRFIRHAKELGFTLKDVKELLDLRMAPTTTCADIRRRAETKITDVRAKLNMLRRIEKALVKLTVSCHGRGPTSECPILDALEQRRRTP